MKRRKLLAFFIVTVFISLLVCLSFWRGVLFRCSRRKLISVYIGEMPRTLRMSALMLLLKLGKNNKARLTSKQIQGSNYMHVWLPHPVKEETFLYLKLDSQNAYPPLMEGDPNPVDNTSASRSVIFCLFFWARFPCWTIQESSQKAYIPLPTPPEQSRWAAGPPAYRHHCFHLFVINVSEMNE